MLSGLSINAHSTHPYEQSDEELYQGLKERFEYREEKHRVPNTFSRETYENIKFSALREIEHRVEKFEKQREEFFQFGGNDDSAKEWANEQKRKDLRQRWAYMMFMRLLWQMDKLTTEGQKVAGNLIWHYRDVGFRMMKTKSDERWEKDRVPRACLQ